MYSKTYFFSPSSWVCFVKCKARYSKLWNVRHTTTLHLKRKQLKHTLARLIVQHTQGQTWHDTTKASEGWSCVAGTLWIYSSTILPEHLTTPRGWSSMNVGNSWEQTSDPEEQKLILHKFNLWNQKYLHQTWVKVRFWPWQFFFCSFQGGEVAQCQFNLTINYASISLKSNLYNNSHFCCNP